MRIAKCVAPLNVHVAGNQRSVLISHGWQGDLDQVVGVTDRGPMTLAEGLGDLLTDTNFDFATRESKKSSDKPKAASAPQSQE